MRVLLISEGTHEGHPAAEKPQALRALVQRILPEDTVYEWISVRDLPRGNPMPGKGGGHFKLALKAMLHAQKNGFDAVVLVTDADGCEERLAEFAEAQQSSKITLPRALGIAVEEFDAWILADQQALSQVLDKTVPMQRSPESIRQPKEECQALLREHDWNGSQAELYAKVCAVLDLENLAERCPKGFKPFLERLKSLVAVGE